MGQDIHLTAEYQTRTGQWLPVPIGQKAEFFFIVRDYQVFNTLVATARGDVENNIADEPRGLPDSMHESTRALFEDNDDLHSHSWISGAEFDLYFPWKATKKEMSHFAIVGHAIRIENYGLPMRFIFAFDN